MFGLLSGVRQYLGEPCELMWAARIGMEMLSFMFLIVQENVQTVQVCSGLFKPVHLWMSAAPWKVLCMLGKCSFSIQGICSRLCVFFLYRRLYISVSGFMLSRFKICMFQIQELYMRADSHEWASSNSRFVRYRFKIVQLFKKISILSNSVENAQKFSKNC